MSFRSELAGGLVFLGVIILTVVGSVWWGMRGFDDPPSPQDVARQAAEKQDDIRNLWMERGKKAVLDQLRDPDSARFSNMVLVKQTTPANAYVLCGSVNSKNGFGGYTGDQPFLVAGDIVAFSRQTNNFVDLFTRFCVNHGRVPKQNTKMRSERAQLQNRG